MKNNDKKIQAVVDKIISLMETEQDKWFKPFSGYTRLPNNQFISNQPFNLVSMRNYTGFNIFCLFGSAYEYPAYATYNQFKELGGNVNKGETGYSVCYYGTAPTTKTDKDGNAFDSTYSFLKFFTVFNIAQTSLADKAGELIAKKLSKIESQKGDKENLYKKKSIPTVADLENFVKNTGAKIVHREAGRCFYVPSLDYINMSPLDTWKGKNGITGTDFYYSTLFHELIHWTKTEERANRTKNNPFDTTGFGSKGYAFEELVAEIGSAITCSMLGHTKVPMENHAQYLASWVKALKDKPSLLMKASAQANTAFKFLMSTQENKMIVRKVA